MSAFGKTLAMTRGECSGSRSEMGSQKSYSNLSHPTQSSSVGSVDPLDICVEHGSPAHYSPGSVISLPDIPSLEELKPEELEENGLSNMSDIHQAIETVEISSYRVTSVRDSNTKYKNKMFIGGLNWETTDESLRNYFSDFGEVLECTVMRDATTGRSRGFGFLTFKDPKHVNTVMVKEHVLDGKIIDPKRAIPRDEQEKTSKIFVGGVSQDTTDQEFRNFFSQFGRVVDATLMMDKDTGRPRGFGFVTFENESGVEACMNTELQINGKPIEVKKAQPRGNMREEEESARRNRFRKGGPGGDEPVSSQGGNMGGGSSANASGMTPQVLAQYMQKMSQYFNMMQQQQMAMGRGMGGMGAMGNMGNMGMNPMMQQMMMAQMMGRGGGGQMNPAMMANMNPAMMQQMQQMMGNMGGGNGPSNAGGNRQNFGGGNFENAGFDQGQAQQRRSGSREAYGNQAYNMGAGAGAGGGPTSWEGMYDDVPQPAAMNNMGQGGGYSRGGHRRGGQHGHGYQTHGGGSGSSGSNDPNHAPPANAPTGPKNAGRPGSNYRGGGRGANRGFHPYGRN